MILSPENVEPQPEARPPLRREKEPTMINILTISLFLAIAAFVVTIAAAMSRAPLWVAVLLLAVLALVKALPPR